MLDPLLQLKSRVDFLESKVSDQDKKLIDQEIKFKAELAKKNLIIELLQERWRLAMARRFGRSADSFLRPDQTRLFDEAELAALNSEEPGIPPEADLVTVEAHQRKKLPRKSRQLPEGLETITVIHALPESELIGPNGEQYEVIGQEVSEKLDVVPMDVRIIRHVCLKYAVKKQEELGVKTAPMPAQIIPRGMASPGLLAHIAQAKYEYHLPLYRQEQIWAGLDIRMPRNIMCQWMMTVGEAVSELLDYLLEDMKLEHYLHADETHVTLLNDPNKKSDQASHRGFMWVYANKTGVRYDYRSSREGKHPLEMLENFTGYLQVDGYTGYNLVSSVGGIIEVGCMAHLRRKFTDVQKSAGKKTRTPVADHVVNLIAKLYQIEKTAKQDNLGHDELYKLRQEKSKPVLDQLLAYIKEHASKAPPTSTLGRALQYGLNHWVQIVRYIDHGILDIDNNAAERCMKPFAVGRKNWMFCGNVRGAQAAANILSLIESAKLHDLKVFDYLSYVFEEIPKATTPRQVEALLPKYVAENKPEFKKQVQTQLELKIQTPEN
jgi:transposase